MPCHVHEITSRNKLRKCIFQRKSLYTKRNNDWVRNACRTTLHGVGWRSPHLHGQDVVGPPSINIIIFLFLGEDKEETNSQWPHFPHNSRNLQNYRKATKIYQNALPSTNTTLLNDKICSREIKSFYPLFLGDL